jgi:hypothetical protein
MIFFLEKFEKVKILDYDSKIDKTHLQGPKNLKKIIFNVLEANLDENLILKKKSHQIYPQIKKFSIFLELV